MHDLRPPRPDAPALPWSTRALRAWPLAVALLGAALARAVGRFALDDFPHVMDEIAYRLQADTFAGGHLVAPLHLPRAAFALWFVDDRWATYSIFPPGWPAVLALPARLGLASWVNPALHAATTLLAGAIGRRVGGPRARVFAATAYALSPQAIVLAASFMSHTLVAFLAALALWASLAPGRARPAAPWLGGAALALLVLTRPLCAAVVAAGVFAFFVRRVRARRPILRGALGFAVPALLGCALLGAYNRALTGSPTRFPQSVYFDEHAAPLDDPQFHYHPGCNDLGFGPGHGCDYGIKDATHTLANAASNTGDNLRAWLLLAGGGPLAFVAFGAAFARRRGRARLVALAAPVPAAILGYALYWYAGTCYGARFYHAALVPLLVVGACAAARLRRRPAWVAMAALFIAWNAIALGGASRELAHGYWGTDARFARLERAWTAGPSVVMVAFRHPRLPERPSYVWTSFLREAIWRNSVRALSALALDGPDLERPAIFAKFHPALVPELRARFPGRELWLYVVEDDAPDTLVRYDASAKVPWLGDAPPPPDNFDGFVMPPR